MNLYGSKSRRAPSSILVFALEPGVPTLNTCFLDGFLLVVLVMISYVYCSSPILRALLELSENWQDFSV